MRRNKAPAVTIVDLVDITEPTSTNRILFLIDCKMFISDFRGICYIVLSEIPDVFHVPDHKWSFLRTCLQKPMGHMYTSIGATFVLYLAVLRMVTLDS